MALTEYPCGQCGKQIAGQWKVTAGWVKAEWFDTDPVKMRTRQETCPHCKAVNDMIEIQPFGTTPKLIKLNKKKRKKRNG